jgi:hypothetical protein
MAEDDAALYSGPFEYLVKNVKPERMRNARKTRAERWWLLGETLPAFRRAINGLTRYIATARVAKHRIFVWLEAVVLPDSKVIAIAREDDFSLGILQSRAHEIWVRANCGWHGGERGTYNPSTCFETFPFPEPTEPQREAIAAAARRLNELRENWLNPPGWSREEVLEFPGSVDGPWSRFVRDPDAHGVGTVRYPRLIPKDAYAPSLKRRTLTALNNERPTWLDQAHRVLDEAVFAAYGWSPSLSDEALLSALLDRNLERAASSSAPPVPDEAPDGDDGP